jgi:hypothetical protein
LAVADHSSYCVTESASTEDCVNNLRRLASLADTSESVGVEGKALIADTVATRGNKAIEGTN